MRSRPLTSRSAALSALSIAGGLLATFLTAGVGTAAAATPGTGTAAQASPSSARLPGTGGLCGELTTAGGYQAAIRVPHGYVTCDTALRVYRQYYKDLRAGRAPGNGGGGPVHVGRWVCQSPPYTERYLPATCVRGRTVVTAHIIGLSR
ncbi:hypothetical protein ACIGXM_12220 [Kitasatospora sp. NPDC052896]|uniref:hypothetical protein n=1 Tax=Kitasatospora sp. NPDC052896 TaxID=3364061 RepID=UPI0037C7B08A